MAIYLPLTADGPSMGDHGLPDSQSDDGEHTEDADPHARLGETEARCEVIADLAGALGHLGQRSADRRRQWPEGDSRHVVLEYELVLILGQSFDGRRLERNLVTGDKGVFDVVVDGKTIYSKGETGRHADDGEVLALFTELVGPEVPRFGT